ncbi:MAG TPA: ABC transporter, partial [Nocardioidaceae bacterium]|nr:ABC transporter [Nocardioidaceae bacterium]
GSAVVGQKLLEAVFGDQAVRRLAEAARKDLRLRVTELMDDERARFLSVLDELDIDTAGVERLREATRKVDDLRAAEKKAPVPALRSSG